MSTITEIVSFKSTDQIPKEDFIKIADRLERNFHSLQPGFIDTELLLDEASDEWIMIQHWASRENQKSASAAIFQSETATEFVRSVIPGTVKMRILPQLKTW